MSRVSIGRRIQRLKDALLHPNSLEWRIECLPDDLKGEYLLWRRKCDDIISGNEKIGRNRYEMLLAGYDETPRMPISVYRCLWPSSEKQTTITLAHSLAEAAQLYEVMLDQGIYQ